MTYKLKKDHLTNWDLQQTPERSTFNDDQNSYISERSSIVSLKDNSPSLKSNNKHLSTSTLPSKPKQQPKDPHSLRYYYNDLPENGIPLATQVREEKKEEKKKKKEYRKAPTGQGSLVPLVETKPPEMSDNYYPYWYYYKVKNPDWIMRHRRGEDGLIIPYDTVHPEQYIHEPNLSTSHSKKSHHHSDKKTNDDIIQKESLPIFDENYDQQKYIQNREYSNQLNKRKLKTENDWNEHYIQSMTTSKLSPDSNTSKHHHHHHHHHSKTNIHNILPNENKIHHHHHHHHHHRHHYQYSPVKELVDTEFQVTDASFKKLERSPYFHQPPNPFQLPPPAIYNQNSYLPPITHDFNTHLRLYPIDYYNSQTFNYDRKDSLKSPEIYKPDKQTNFYDRYLNNVITKKI